MSCILLHICMYLLYRVVFLTGPPRTMSLYWPPPNLLGLAPPNLSKCWNHIHFARYLDVFDHEGGPVQDSNVFLKSVTYRPTLGKFRGGPVKKITLYVYGMISSNKSSGLFPKKQNLNEHLVVFPDEASSVTQGHSTMALVNFPLHVLFL